MPVPCTSWPLQYTWPLVGSKKARDDVQDGGLAAAGGAYHRNELVLGNVQIHAVQGDHFAVAAVELFTTLSILSFYSSLLSCHPVSFLSKVLMIFFHRDANDADDDDVQQHGGCFEVVVQRPDAYLNLRTRR